jgi:diaminopropionate ammonia-lyase
MSDAEAFSFTPFSAPQLVCGGAATAVFRSTPRSVKPVPLAGRDPLAFHRSFEDYRESPLIDLEEVAAELGLDRLMVKDETRRLGLPSFKILGATWAIVRALYQRLGETLPAGAGLAEVARTLEGLKPLTLVAATDGNHGRAVARVAARFGFEASILVPIGMAASRIRAIEEEGAAVTVVDGSYDEAVELAATLEDERSMVIADTGWPGYEDVPRWISQGYSTIFWEVDEALARAGAVQPDLVIVQIGVGALAMAVVAHYRRAELTDGPAIVGVEPLSADCVLDALAAGEPTYVPGPHPSVMAGLNAGRVSRVALPALADGLDAVVAIPDDHARDGVRALHRQGVEAGETGAAGLGALLNCRESILSVAGSRARNVLVLLTEGPTDPVSYRDTLAGSSTAVAGARGIGP